MKKRKITKIKYRDVELNIMPFIDIFSLLNTFLLMSAVFLSVGVIEVQIPFLSSNPPKDEKDEKPCDVKVDMEKEKIEASAEHCQGVEPKKTVGIDKGGMLELHRYLVGVRRANPE